MSVVFALLTANLALMVLCVWRTGSARRPSSIETLLNEARVSNSVVSFRPRGPEAGDGIVVPFRRRDELAVAHARRAHPSSF